MAGKYEPLQRRLEELSRRGDTTADFSFSDIEALTGPLPPVGATVSAVVG
jgi:hypothetical protein